MARAAWAAQPRRLAPDEAEAYLRARLAEIDPELLERLDFDSEADALSVSSPVEADLLRVIEQATRRWGTSG